MCPIVITLKVEYKYIGNADGFAEHTLPQKPANWVKKTPSNSSWKFIPGWGDEEIKDVIAQAIQNAKANDKLKSQYLNSFVFDTGKHIGVANGKRTSKMEIKN